MLEQELQILKSEISNCYAFTYQIINEGQKHFSNTCFLSNTDVAAIETAYFNFVPNMQVIISFYDNFLLNIAFSYTKNNPSECENPYFGYVGKKTITFESNAYISKETENYYAENRREYLRYLINFLKENETFNKKFKDDNALLKIFTTIFAEGFDPELRADIIRNKILPLFKEKVNTLRKTVNRTKAHSSTNLPNNTKKWEEQKKEREKQEKYVKEKIKTLKNDLITEIYG